MSLREAEALTDCGLRGDRYAEAANRKSPDYQLTLIERDGSRFADVGLETIVCRSPPPPTHGSQVPGAGLLAHEVSYRRHPNVIEGGTGTRGMLAVTEWVFTVADTAGRARKVPSCLVRLPQAPS